MKQIRLYIVAFFLILAYPLTVMAAEDTYSEGHFYYRSHEGYVSISGYLGQEEEVTIPESMAGKPVAEIEDHAFDECNSIMTIIVPATVTMIGEEAFTGAASLKKIVSQTEGVNIVAKDTVTIEDDFTGNSNTTGETGFATGSSITANATIEDGGYDEVEENTGNTENPVSENTPTGISISNSDIILTVDKNRHLISIDGSGNPVVLDDAEEYTQTETEDGTITIKNSKGEEVIVDENGNVRIPKEKTNYVLASSIAMAALLVIGVGTVAIFRKKREKKNAE